MFRALNLEGLFVRQGGFLGISRSSLGYISWVGGACRNWLLGTVVNRHGFTPSLEVNNSYDRFCEGNLQTERYWRLHI